MSDIIQQSKLLLNAIKHEYKALESRGAKPGKYDYDGFELWLDSTLLYGDGSEQTRHAIEAVTEEEYQYGVTYIGVKHGGHHIEWVESTGDAEWDKGTLQRLVKGWERKGQSPKIVRRRVSPVEVIE